MRAIVLILLVVVVVGALAGYKLVSAVTRPPPTDNTVTTDDDLSLAVYASMELQSIMHSIVPHSLELKAGPVEFYTDSPIVEIGAVTIALIFAFAIVRRRRK